MAAVAGGAGAVHVRRIPSMSAIHGRFGMATVIRTHEDYIVRTIEMAGCAHAAGAAVTCAPPTVREFTAQPIRCRMACRAGCRNNSRGSSIHGKVIRHGSTQSQSALPCRGVATVTIRRRDCCGQVAQIACRRDVRSGQGESCGGVVKRRVQPVRRRMAGRASLRISQRNVVGHHPAKGGGALPLRDVAVIAIRRQRAAVISVHVAKCARGRDMRSRQGECRRVVIESRSGPVRCRVAK